MARVKSRDTQPELVVRRLLHRMGYRFRLHRKEIPGRPDIVLPKYRKVIFVHGCFWHGHQGCCRAARPASNSDFWKNKLSGNMERDRKNLSELKKQGWGVLVVWQCELKDAVDLEHKLTVFLNR